MNLGVIAAGRRRLPTSLDLNFAAGTYLSGTTPLASASAVPGFACSRTGQVGVINVDGSAAFFAANVPPINGYGLHSYEALTNISLQSQALDSASWAKTNASVAADVLTAPDGTATADLLTTAATGVTKAISQTRTVTPGLAYTAVFFVKRGTSINCYKYSIFDVTHGVDIIARTDYAAQVDAGGAWSRIAVGFTVPVGCTQVQLFPVNSALSEHNVTLGLWQVEIVAGAFPAGGPPLIATTGASASIGVQDLSFGLTDGSYTALYTFEDGSTQSIPTIVAGGTFHLATYPTILTRPRVARVQVA